MSRLLLAGDIGGTSTRLGLFEPRPARPRAMVVRTFATRAFDDVTSMIAAFMADESVTGATVEGACFGVAGPVLGDTARLTHVPWEIDARRVAAALGVSRVRLLNDLEALASAVPVLDDSEHCVLQRGLAAEGGNIALIAAGTGLGEALLHRVDGRFVPCPSEGGQADFAARTERDIVLLRELTARHGRVAVEDVVSGRGLCNIYRALHAGPCPAGVDPDDADAPAAISSSAIEGRCRGCVDALDVFLEAYGAEAGNLALRSLATGGVRVGGGIAPKILPALAAGPFMEAFRRKAPHEALLERMPVLVILNDEAALVGAAVRAAAA